MVHGRTGTRALDDPAYDDLFATAARGLQPIPPPPSSTRFQIPDYPFHRPGAAAVEHFFDAIPGRCDRSKIASGNAQDLFRLA